MGGLDASKSNHIVVCVPVPPDDPYTHGALEVVMRTMVQDGDLLTVLVVHRDHGGAESPAALGRRPSQGGVEIVTRDERQNVYFMKAILEKMHRWYPKNCAIEVRPLPVRSDPVGTILKACEALQPSLLVLPRHQIRGTLWNILHSDLPAALFERAPYPVVAIKNELPLAAVPPHLSPATPPASPTSAPPVFSQLPRSITDQSGLSSTSTGRRASVLSPPLGPTPRRKSVIDALGLGGRDPSASKEEEGQKAVGGIGWAQRY